MKKTFILILLLGLFMTIAAKDYSDNVLKMTDRMMETYIKKIELTQDQVEKIKPVMLEKVAFMESNRPQPGQLMGDKTADRKKIQERNKKYDEKIAQYLNKEQKQKFEEMQAERREGRSGMQGPGERPESGGRPGPGGMPPSRGFR